MTKICDADPPTLFRHKNPDNSGTVDACGTSCISSGRYRRVVSRLRKAERFGRELRELGSKRGRGWENGVALVRNRSTEFRETSGGGRDVRKGLGERGNRGNRAPSPEILQISPYSVFLQRMGDIFGCAGANATKNTSSERSCRVERESRFARGTSE
ncbi:hypothetical protein BKA83DRAFT_1139053 [Pisolithus microcarpus]|nr:hypothetical protein BKA83DRAFT_1139053 [Pisolithus microcarpus]